MSMKLQEDREFDARQGVAAARSWLLAIEGRAAWHRG